MAVIVGDAIGTVGVSVIDAVIVAVEVDVKDGVGRGDEVNVGLEVKGVGVGVRDGVDVKLGVELGGIGGVGVLVWSVDGQPPGGAGTRSSGSLMCGCAAADCALAKVISTYVPAPVA